MQGKIVELQKALRTSHSRLPTDAVAAANVAHLREQNDALTAHNEQLQARLNSLRRSSVTDAHDIE
eukprot:965889-Prymnesium_polylepis.1